jgi:hypothetical protein
MPPQPGKNTDRAMKPSTRIILTVIGALGFVFLIAHYLPL